MIDILATNLLPSEQPITHEEALDDISRTRALLVLKVHKQTQGKAWGTKLQK